MPPESVPQATFANMPDGPGFPGSPPPMASTPDPAPQPAPAPEPPAPQQAQPAPAAQPQYIPVPIPTNQGQELFQALQSYDQVQANREAQQQAQQQWNQMFTPPALPEDPDQLIYNGQALRNHLQQQAEWTANLARNVEGRLAAALNARDQQWAQYSYQQQQAAIAPIYQWHAEQATERAIQNLEAQGYEKAREVVPMFEQTAQADPNNYWRVRTDPRAVEMGMEWILKQRGDRPSARTHSTSSPSLGYHPGVPTSQTGMAGPSKEAIAAFERFAGKPLRAEYLTPEAIALHGPQRV